MGNMDIAVLFGCCIGVMLFLIVSWVFPTYSDCTPFKCSVDTLIHRLFCYVIFSGVLAISTLHYQTYSDSVMSWLGKDVGYVVLCVSAAVLSIVLCVLLRNVLRVEQKALLERAASKVNAQEGL